VTTPCFLTFWWSCASSRATVCIGNILTVADDLLKNDGQKFLEMMEQLAERRMQREQQAAQDLEEDSDADDDDEGDEDDEDEDDDDDDDDEEDEEEVCHVAHSFSPYVGANVCRRSPRIRRWRRGNACSPFLPHACSNRGSSRRTVKRLHRNARCSCYANLRLRTERPRIARRVKPRRTRRRRTNGGLYSFHYKLPSQLTAIGPSRQQKQAKEEGRAQRAAEKAAEEAAFKEKQAQLEATQKKKREEEKARREAARKQAEDERARKEEERRRRAVEEKEREAERERKRREKEERLKAERRDKEERERKAKEDREAKLATERAAKKEREGREERDRKAREEKEAKERVAAKEREQQQQRAAANTAASVAATNKGPLRTPTSPRNATPSGSSSQRSPNNALSSKKVANKTQQQPAQSSAAPSPVASRAPSQSQAQPAPGSQTVAPTQQSQPQRQPMTVSTTPQPLLPVTPQLPPVPPLPSPLFSPNGPSPRGFAPPSTPFGVPAPSFASARSASRSISTSARVSWRTCPWSGAWTVRNVLPPCSRPACTHRAAQFRVGAGRWASPELKQHRFNTGAGRRSHRASPRPNRTSKHKRGDHPALCNLHVDRIAQHCIARAPLAEPQRRAGLVCARGR
jgi:hypothetical protein